VDENVLERRDDALDLERRETADLERARDRRAPLVGIVDDDVKRRAERGDFVDAVLAFEQRLGVEHARAGDLEHRAPREDLLELGNASHRDDPSRMHERDPVAALGLVEVMSRHDQRDARRGERVDQMPELPSREGIDPSRRLVEEDDLRLVQQRAGKRETLLPASGKRAGHQPFLPFQPRDVDRPGAPRFERSAAKAVDAAEESEVLPDRQVVVEGKALRHVADAPLEPLRLARDVDPENVPDARGWTKETAEHPDGRRLAGPVRA